MGKEGSWNGYAQNLKGSATALIFAAVTLLLIEASNINLTSFPAAELNDTICECNVGCNGKDYS